MTVSLTQRASVVAVASLWNRPDVIADIKRLILELPRFHPSNNLELNLANFKPWNDIENKVISLLHDIFLPKVLKSFLNNLVQPMGLQILKWVHLTQQSFQICGYLPEPMRFVWNGRGIIDYYERAKLIIESSSDNLLRYLLACIFCLEETIRELWPLVECLFNEKNCIDLKAVGSKAGIYWTCYLRGEIEHLMSLQEQFGLIPVTDIHEFGFLYLLDSMCVSSLKYFMKFIQPERRQELVIVVFNAHNLKDYDDGNLIYYLLSLLTPLEANGIMRRHSALVLSSMLEWSCHEYFMPIANSSWANLKEKDILYLLKIFVDFVSRYHVGDFYANLFRQFWMSSPRYLREFVKRDFLLLGGFAMRLLLYENTKKITQVIFNDYTPEERKQIIFSVDGMNVCDLLSQKKDNWASLKFFVKNCIPDRSTLQAFIEENKKCFFAECKVDKRANVMFEKMKEWY